MKEFSPSSIRLWQLISPALPIGAYAYSQGLEYAIDTGWVTDEKGTSDWVLGQIKNNLCMLDVPVFIKMYEAWQNDNFESVTHWNQMLLALRESSELRQEDTNLGNALIKVLTGLDVKIPECISPECMSNKTSFLSVFSFACHYWSIDMREAIHGYLWSWCENQVASAIKLVPLGQTSGQRIMSSAIEVITLAVDKGLQCEDEDIGLLAPAMAIGSALHETQYSRLFRS